MKHLLLSLLIAAPLIGFAQADETATAPAQPAIKTPVTLSASRGSMRGILEPRDDVYLSCQMGGVVVAYPHPEGSAVKAGDAVVQLDDRMEQAELAQIEAVMQGVLAELDKAQEDFARVSALRKENIASEKQLGEATLALASAKSRCAQVAQNLAIAKIKLSYRSILAPFDGLFFKKTKSVGEFIGTAETAARVIDNSRIQMTVYVGPDYFGKFHAGQTVQIRLLDGPAKGHLKGADIIRVDPLIDPANGTFRAQLELKPTDEVVPGLSAVMLPETVQNKSTD